MAEDGAITAAAEEMLRNVSEKTAAAEKALLESKVCVHILQGFQRLYLQV